MGKWSELPVNLLQVLEDCLVLYVDKVRMRAVCVSWNSRLPKIPNHKDKQFPWLLQALDDSIEASHALFNPIEKKVYQLDLPEAQGKLFKGSSHGWVVTVEDKHSTSPTDIYLINPLTRVRIKLPSRIKFPDVRNYRANKVDQEYALNYSKYGSYQFYSFDYVNLNFTDKVVLSSAPSSNDCMVVAIYGSSGKLACCKCNDKKWRPLQINNSSGKKRRPLQINNSSDILETCFVDVIFHKGKLHALNKIGQLLLFESIGIGIGLTSKVTIIATGLPDSLRVPYVKYLVECSDGGLILVARYFNFLGIDDIRTPPIPRTYCFRVFKLDSINSSWIEVKNIGNDILFLGLNSSFSISSCHFPPEYQGNQIYFTDSIYSIFGKVNKQEDSDIGVFNLEDATLQSLPGLKSHPQFLWPPPIWVNIG